MTNRNDLDRAVFKKLMPNHHPRKMPINPPSPLANSPMSSRKPENSNCLDLPTSKGQQLTCVELGLVDEAAGLDVKVEGRGPVPRPGYLLRCFLNEGERS